MARRVWNRSLRLLFEVAGGEIRLLSKQQVNMMPPPAPDAPSPGQSGAWAELRTTADEPIYHQVLAHLSAPGAEVFSPDPRQSMRRVDTVDRPQTFIVVVPDTDDARALVIMGPSQFGARRNAAEAVSAATGEIARFDLDADPTGGRS